MWVVQEHAADGVIHTTMSRGQWGPTAEVSRISASDPSAVFCHNYSQAVGLNHSLLATDTNSTVQPELLTQGCYLFSVSDFCSGQTALGDWWGRTFMFSQIPVLKDAENSFHLSASKGTPFPTIPLFNA